MSKEKIIKDLDDVSKTIFEFLSGEISIIDKDSKTKIIKISADMDDINEYCQNRTKKEQQETINNEN